MLHRTSTVDCEVMTKFGACLNTVVNQHAHQIKHKNNTKRCHFIQAAGWCVHSVSKYQNLDFDCHVDRLKHTPGVFHVTHVSPRFVVVIFLFCFSHLVNV